MGIHSTIKKTGNKTGARAKVKSVQTTACTVVAIVFANTFAFAQETLSSTETDWPNAYDQVRSEQLLQQGQQLMREGQYEYAERIFLDAMQITKINFGLNAPRQRIPLEFAINAQLAQGKWEQVENHLSYFEHLNDEVYSRDFYDYLRGTEQLSSLLLRASADADNPMAVRYLIAAKNLNWRAVSAIEATLGENHLSLAPWLYNIVLTHYYQSSLTKQGVNNYVYRTDNNEEYAGWTLNRGDSLRISYRIGKELLQRIEAIYADAANLPTESRALAQVYQADWEMLFGHEEDALAHYQKAYQGLLAAGLSENEANRVFARPTVLPAGELHTSLEELIAQQPQGPVQFHAWTPNYPATALPSKSVAINGGTGNEIMALVRFDLHPLLPSGLINNNKFIRLGFNLADLEVIESNPDNEQIRERARHEVSLLQFRPKLENGAPVSLENVELEYRFPPQYYNLTVSGN